MRQKQDDQGTVEKAICSTKFPDIRRRGFVHRCPKGGTLLLAGVLCEDRRVGTESIFGRAGVRIACGSRSPIQLQTR